jgi:hypothetical protein
MTTMDQAARRLIEIERTKRVCDEARQMLAKRDGKSPFLHLVVHVLEGRITRISVGGSFESKTVGGRAKTPTIPDEVMPPMASPMAEMMETEPQRKEDTHPATL